MSISEKAKERNKQWQINNPEKCSQYTKKYNLNHPEKRKEYLLKNKERIKEYCKEYAKLDKEIERKRKWAEENPEHNKIYYEKNKEKLSSNRKEYYLKNKDVIDNKNKQWKKDHPDYETIYRIEHHEEILERMRLWMKNKTKTDMKYNINNKIRNEIRRSLRGSKAGRHWEDLVGYTLEDLIKRLKSTMPDGYTWQDVLDSKKLHIDHKIPISAFNYDKPEHLDFKRCWALSNLRLLPARENIIKSNHLTNPFQPALKLNIVGVI